MPDLTTLRAEADKAGSDLHALVERLFPGKDLFDWYRACDAINGGIARRNADPSFDVALANSAEIGAAHVAYMQALHAFYVARDGANGFLGRA